MMSQYPNEVGAHTPKLQARLLNNPIAVWVAAHITTHTRHPVPEFHLDIYDELAFGKEDAVIKAPRSFAKSTVCSENFSVYHACEYPRLKKMANPPVFPFKKIQIVSSTGTKAEEIMNHIKGEIENNGTIVAEFGVIEGDKWQQRFIKTKDGFELRVGGRGCQIRGFRPEIVILDDIEDDEEVQSDEQMEKTRIWIDSAVINTLDEIECRLFAVGTVLHPDCALNYLGKKPGIKVMSYQAYIDAIEQPGYELWPSKWSHERLQKRKAKIGQRAFRQEFLNDPLISQSPIFMREWWQKYDSKSRSFMESLKKGMYTVQTVDPAISKADKADYTALVTLSATFEKEPKIYMRVGGIKRGHWNLGATVVEVFEIHNKFGCKEVGIETTAYQQALSDEFRLYMESHRRKIQITEFKPDRDKERRSHVVAPMVERGQVYYDPDDEMSCLLIDECVNFQPGKTNIKKDLMDAFVYGLKMIKDWTGRGATVTPQADIGFGKQVTYGRT